MTYLNIDQAYYIEKYLYYPLGHPPGLLYYEIFCNVNGTLIFRKITLGNVFPSHTILALVDTLPLELSTAL